jgi:hypothetical protein
MLKSVIVQHNHSPGQLPSDRKKHDALAAAAYKEEWAEIDLAPAACRLFCHAVLSGAGRRQSLLF